MRHIPTEISTATMRHALGRGLAGVAMAASCMACGSKNPTTPINVYAAIVHGVVKSGANVPLGGVQIESETYRGGCGVSQKIGGSSPVLATTDASGRFTQQIVTEDSASNQCLRVIARPQGGSPISVDATGLRLKLYADASLPYDSIRVDVMVP
jgi:hypothetical protein